MYPTTTKLVHLFLWKFQDHNMAHLHDAIRALNSSIITINGEDAYDKDGNPVQYDMSQAQAKLAELETQEVQEEQASKDAKASALAKLTALGLSESEVKALLGQ